MTEKKKGASQAKTPERSELFERSGAPLFHFFRRDGLYSGQEIHHMADPNQGQNPTGNVNSLAQHHNEPKAYKQGHAAQNGGLGFLRHALFSDIGIQCFL